MYRTKMKVVVYNKEYDLYTIGYVAKLIGKSVETIRAWERQKVIPPPLFKTKKVRLYHPDEAQAMKKVLKKVGKKAKKKDIQKEMWSQLSPVRKEILAKAKGEQSQV